MSGSDPAFPHLSKQSRESALQSGREAIEVQYSGLTKRELFAAMAMQGYCASQFPEGDVEYAMVAQNSVKMADALLAELERGG